MGLVGWWGRDNSPMLTEVRPWAAAVLVPALLTDVALPQTALPWKDGFEQGGLYAPQACYIVGTDPQATNCGGWEYWDGIPTTGARISTTFSKSGNQSLFNGGASDIVQRFNQTSGSWSVRASMYMPSFGPEQMTKDTWFNLMNTYVAAGGPKISSLVVGFDPSTGTVTRYAIGNIATFGYAADQWMCLEAQIDIDNRLVDFYVDGVPLGSTWVWRTQGSPAGMNFPATLAAINLWSNIQTTSANPNGGASYDDFSITPIPGLSGVSCCPKTELTCGPAFIGQSGTPGPTGGPDHVVSAAPTRGCRAGLLLYTDQPIVAPGTGFGGPGSGLLCLQPMGLRRAGPIDSGGTSPNTCDGVMAINMDQFNAGSWTTTGCNPPPGQTNPAGFLGSLGTTVNAQMWGRDSIATGQVLSDGIRWVVGP